jgi:hypothetical protein
MNIFVGAKSRSIFFETEEPLPVRRPKQGKGWGQGKANSGPREVQHSGAA